MRTLLALPLVILAGLFVAACGSSSNSSSGGSSVAGSGYGQPVAAGSAATTSSSGHQVVMHDNAFAPTVITGKPGQTVTVKLRNAGQNKHNFQIAGQKASDADVGPGQTATVKVRIPMSGSVQFYCEYHRSLGMVGTVKPA